MTNRRYECKPIDPEESEWFDPENLDWFEPDEQVPEEQEEIPSCWKCIKDKYGIHLEKGDMVTTNMGRVMTKKEWLRVHSLS